MAIADTHCLVAYPPISIATAGANVVLDGANEKHAFVFRVPKTGTIDRVYFRTATVTLGDTLDVRLETVDLSTGDPTGTLVGTNTNASQVVALTDDNTWFEVTLTAGASVTRGQTIALVLTMPAVPVGNMQIQTTLTGSWRHATEWGNTNYADSWLGASWAKDGSIGFIGAVRYNDASYAPIPQMWPYSTAGAVTFNIDSNPDERGNRLILPFTARCVGIWSVMTRGGGTLDYKLYDSASTLLESVFVDLTVSVADNTQYALFDSSVTLTAGEVYRCVLSPDTTTNVTGREITTATASLMDAMPGGAVIHKTTRNNGGGWTDTTTVRMGIGLLFDGFDDGTSTGVTQGNLGVTSRGVA